jgi:hypothetical protein
MRGPRLGQAAGPGVRSAQWALAGLGLLIAGAGAAPAPGTGHIVARLGPITITTTALRHGRSGTLTASLQVSTSGQNSDQLDAAIAGSGSPVGMYHQQVNVGEITDLTGCGGDPAPPRVVDHWLHYGPLLVPGRTGGPAKPASATLLVQQANAPARQAVAITLYFAQAGAVTVDLPVERS